MTAVSDAEADIFDQAAEVDQDPVPGLGDPPEPEPEESGNEGES